MATTADTLHLDPDSMAFVFDSDVGVSAADLGLFLQRASTVSRRVGAELYVVGLRDGSLAVIAKVVRRGAQASIKEFKSSPIRTSAAAVTLVGVVVGALGLAMTPRPGQVSPLAKAGASLVEDHSITQISLISLNQTVVVMDKERAAEVRMSQVESTHENLPSAEVRKLVSSAGEDGISGTVLIVSGEAHFRPDGFRYLVPIHISSECSTDLIRDNQHVTVMGELLLRNLQPDLLIIREARRG